MQNWETVWTFKTRNFKVTLDCTIDSDVDLSFDETGETRANIESGLWTAYVFRVNVYYHDVVVGGDYLGGSIYEHVSDFMDHRLCGAQNRAYAARGETARCGSYFTQMISEAIREARAHFADMPKLRNVA